MSSGRGAARGAQLALLGWGAGQGITLAAYIVLAHLLAPSTFGSFTAGTILIAFGFLFAESGTTAALISRHDRIEEAASSAFFWLVASGTVLSLVSLACSPLVAAFFDNNEAGKVAAALSGWLLLHSLPIVPDALLQRRASVARRVAVDPLGALAFAGVSVAACEAGAGIWGLVAGIYASELVEVCASWGFARFRPRWGLASRAMWREIAAFARPVLGSEILRRVAGQLDVIMLGRFSSASALGQYRNGFRLAVQPVNAFVDVGAYVALPKLARMAREPQRLNAAVKRLYRLALGLGVPLSLALVPLGVPTAVLLLGDRWRPAGHVIACLWGLMLGGAIGSVAAESAKAVGRPGALVRIQGLSLAVTAVLVGAAAVPFGAVGVATAVSLSQVLAGSYAMAIIAPSVGLGWGELVGEFVTPLVSSGVMVAGMLAFSAITDPLARGVGIGLLLTLAEAVAGGFLYVVVLAGIDRSRRSEMLAAARSVSVSLRSRYA